jgi:NADP-dependent aldehyde dehydrogenase
VIACGLPDGVFSLLNGNSHELGAALVADPRIKAVGFTGSRAGGLALLRIAAAREQPIPVYAEMSSINPVVLLPAALTADADVLARQFITSMTLGAGQFCTNPGLVLALDSPDLERFMAAAAAALQGVAPGVMLTPSIQAAYESGVARLLRHQRVTTLGRGAPSQAQRCARGALFAVHAASLLDDKELMDEVFGASSLIVRCRDEAQLVRVLEQLEGQLTATLHVRAHDYELASRLVPILERKPGRLIVNGWPTGVEVAHAMVHGGPFPATSDGRSTSVGTLAVERFQRAICYQDFPEALLPRPLRNDSYEKHPHRSSTAPIYPEGAKALTARGSLQRPPRETAAT